MDILPEYVVNLDAATQGTTALTIPREYAWDFENNDFRLINGKFIIVEGAEALEVWIWKAIHTLKLAYSIYSDKYGHELDTLVGQGYSVELIETEANRLVWECLSQNPHITSIENFSVSIVDDTLVISFTAITDQGGVNINANV